MNIELNKQDQVIRKDHGNIFRYVLEDIIQYPNGTNGKMKVQLKSKYRK